MFVLLLSATLVAAIAAKNSYVIVTPSRFRPGLPVNISVNILNSSAPVMVTADLATNKSGIIQKISGASGNSSFSQGIPGTLLVPVPDNLKSLSYPDSYLLQVKGSGQGLHFRNQTYISYAWQSMSIFIQTDKAMYKPGQTVNFRAVATFPNLTVYNGPMDIDIYDPNSNKIKQWRGLKSTAGVITNYMLMDTQPVLGYWRIKVTCKNVRETKYFQVKEYVLPKFEVKVELPSFILTTDSTLSGKVKATYTYGKPVKGTVHLRAKFDYWYGPYGYYGVIPMVTRTFDINGEASFDIPLGHLSQIERNLNYKSLVVEANVTEEINDITLGASSKVRFHDQAVKVQFLRSNSRTFKPGLPYTAYLKVSQHDGTPMVGARKDVRLKTLVSYALPKVDPTPYAWYFTVRNYYDLPDQMLAVPDSGIVAMDLKIPGNATNIKLTATYDSSSDSLSIDQTHSPSNSYMQLMLKSKDLKAGQSASFDILTTESFSVAFYQVMSRGSVVSAGQVSGSSLSINVTDKMAPTARIIAYYIRDDGEIVADSIGFDVDGVFLNQVSLSFNKTKAQPHENVNLMVTADPASVVNLLAVDQSVLLMASGNDITSAQVIKELKNYDTIYHSYYVNDFYMPISYGGIDALHIFDNAGVHVMTDAMVFQQHGANYPRWVPGQLPTALPGLFMATTLAHFEGMGGSGANMKDVGRIRREFPETWLWSNSTVGPDGRVTVNTTIPDTITSWVASAFAVNSKTGLGVSPTTAKVQAFRPFFVSLNLPYSVVRGEQLAMQANVFNYMSQDLDVLVTLENSTCFKNIIVDSHGHEQYVSQEQADTVHVPAGEVKSVFFPIVPHCIGRSGITVKAQSSLAADAIRRQLLVEPEGVLKEFSTPVMIDLKNATSFNQTVSLSLPAGVVNGSERVVVKAIGDVLGPSLNGLHQLLRMPVGCGEQTMTAFAPDVFISNYLSATNQLSKEIEDTALMYMEKGYQRELSYQRYDGSFSAFGNRDSNGSMWLTAFVAKSFHQAKHHIYIDDYTLTRAITWIINNQAADGHFPEPGHVHNTFLQGGAQHGPGLTAFVLISLLENNDLNNKTKVDISRAAAKAQAYLEAHVASMTDDYVLAITSYALRLANSAMFSTVFNKFNNHAIIKDGLKHWHRNQTRQTTQYYWRPPHQQANPIDIEMTSYALLIHAVNHDYAAGMPVMMWLTRQRNSFGGFASTQDTVIGLQALSEFASKVYSNNTAIQATISDGTTAVSRTVNQANALVLQTVPWSSFPNQLTVSATGHGFALVDIALSFHVEQEIEEPLFDVQVTLVNETLNLLRVKTCTKWLGSGSSGMAVQEFGIPTGFEADLESIAGIKEIKRTETENRKVILYFDEISTKPICLTLEVFRTGLVANSQAAAIRVYDYYQPRNQVTKFYQSHLIQNAEICDLCPSCGCPTTA